MHHLCEEINDLIQEAGQASLTDLSRNFNLPYNFLLEVHLCTCMCTFVYATYMHVLTNVCICIRTYHIKAVEMYSCTCSLEMSTSKR